jgi:hypothetical protein
MLIFRQSLSGASEQIKTIFTKVIAEFRILLYPVRVFVEQEQSRSLPYQKHWVCHRQAIASTARLIGQKGLVHWFPLLVKFHIHEFDLAQDR